MITTNKKRLLGHPRDKSEMGGEEYPIRAPVEDGDHEKLKKQSEHHGYKQGKDKNWSS